MVVLSKMPTAILFFKYINHDYYTNKAIYIANTAIFQTRCIIIINFV
jgi:hypothetical protein